MLGNREAYATIAVQDIVRARKFYTEVLGLEPIRAMGDELTIFKNGHSKLVVYRSRYASTNQATALTWTVGSDVEEIVAQLKAKGVRFEHYEMPGLTLQGDVHVGQGMKMAWFKDPDGNIHNVVSG